ncbi:MAG: hypothetical protein IPF48_06455 [Sphingomonadales bacterium]|nr:hypothetical protein [Sphingomonadales bacterium]MBK6490602.1 hypothetical protein [Sphingomonadales bacterium]MBK6719441.1 hypothetical protein [Sphingomonadales bacterium]MBK7284112.1 hypothetical protein [Sphingomonadales bacterium]MBK8273152.1 hypothetical protein [Sphingomonadales bacterium]
MHTRLLASLEPVSRLVSQIVRFGSRVLTDFALSVEFWDGSFVAKTG